MFTFLATLSLLALTDAEYSGEISKLPQNILLSQVQRGNCPIISSGGQEPNPSYGLWYLTYTTLSDLSDQIVCSVAIVDPLPAGEFFVTSVTYLTNNESYNNVAKMVPWDRNDVVFQAYASVLGEKVKFYVSYTSTDDDAKLVWACGELFDGQYHLEVAQVFSKDMFSPPERVREFATFLQERGSDLGKFRRLHAEKCIGIIGDPKMKSEEIQHSELPIWTLIKK